MVQSWHLGTLAPWQLGRLARVPITQQSVGSTNLLFIVRVSRDKTPDEKPGFLNVHIDTVIDVQYSLRASYLKKYMSLHYASEVLFLITCLNLCLNRFLKYQRAIRHFLHNVHYIEKVLAASPNIIVWSSQYRCQNCGALTLSGTSHQAAIGEAAWLKQGIKQQ